MSNTCALAGESDIYGIGIRIAVYAQNLLVFIPAYWALKDGDIRRSSLICLETQSGTILIISFAILITAIIQASNQQINIFHTLIILNLSWISSANTFLWFVLYIHHVCWERGLGAIHLLQMRFWTFQADSLEEEECLVRRCEEGKIPAMQGPSSAAVVPQKATSTIWPRWIVFLGTIHLSVIGALGIWMWSNPHTFGNPIPCNTAYQLTFTILFIPASMVAAGTRIASLVIYSAVLIPFINILIPVVFITVVYGWWNSRLLPSDGVHRITTTHPAPMYLAMGTLIALNIIFICDIELTIAQNRKYQGNRDLLPSPWTFGQTLPLLLLAVPIRNIFVTLRQRRDHLLFATMDDALGVVLDGNPHKVVRELIQNGADPNMESNNHGTKLTCPLQLAVNNNDVSAILYYAKRGVKFSAKPGTYGTAFEYALALNQTPVLEALVTLDNTRPEECTSHDQDLVDLYRMTALGGKPPGLQYGAHLGSVPALKYLLDFGQPMDHLDPKENDSILHTAVKRENYRVVLFILLLMDRLDGVKRRPLKSEPLFRLNDPIYEVLGIKGYFPPKVTPVNVLHTNKQGESALSLAFTLWGKESRIFRLLLEYLASRTPTDNFGNSALHIETRAGRREIVRLLVSEGVDILSKNKKGWTPLHLATGKGNLEIVNILLKANADPNPADDNGWTPLFHAVFSRHHAIVTALLSASSNASAASKDNSTPLHIAAELGYPDIVKVLLKADANPSATDKSSLTPLHVAVRCNHLDIVRILLNFGTDVPDENGQTPFWTACCTGRVKIARLLLGRQNVEPDSRDKNGQSPLLVAALGGHVEIVKLLLGRPNVEADSRDRNGQSPLWAAAHNGHIEVCRSLLAIPDVQADFCDQNGQSPVWAASRSGSVDIVSLLLDRPGVRADFCDNSGQSPLWIAASNGHVEVVRMLLLKPEVKADSRDKNGQSPLWAAARDGHLEIVELLLASQEVEADSRDKDGRSPLWAAACNGSVEIARLLLERPDVEPHSRDKDGLSPILLAKNNPRMRSLLEARLYLKKLERGSRP